MMFSGIPRASVPVAVRYGLSLSRPRGLSPHPPFPCRARGADHPAVRAERGLVNRERTRLLAPDMLPRRGNEALPVEPAGEAQSAANDHRPRVEHVDEKANAVPQRLTGRTHDLCGLVVTVRRGRQHILGARHRLARALAVTGGDRWARGVLLQDLVVPGAAVGADAGKRRAGQHQGIAARTGKGPAVVYQTRANAGP